MKGINPKPLIDDDSRPFWEGARDRKLLLQRCRMCDRYVFYPRSVCPHCFSDELSWEETSGKGSIVSYTVVHRAPPPFAEQTPYALGLIQLREGPRMVSRLVGERSAIAIGKEVEVVFEKIDEEVTLPYFQLL